MVTRQFEVSYDYLILILDPEFMSNISYIRIKYRIAHLLYQLLIQGRVLPRPRKWLSLWKIPKIIHIS